MLTEETKYHIEITEDDNVQVRERTYILRNGERHSHSNHRKVIQRGQDYSGEARKVRRICNIVFEAETE